MATNTNTCPLYDVLLPAIGQAILASGGGTPVAGVPGLYHNVDRAVRLSDGTIVQHVIVNRLTASERYEYRAYSPMGVAAVRFEPTPIGIRGGRYSDYQAYCKDLREAARAFGIPEEMIQWVNRGE